MATAAVTIYIRLLGRVAVRCDCPVTLEPPPKKGGELTALLATHSPTPQSAGRVLEAQYTDVDVDLARDQLHVAVSRGNRFLLPVTHGLHLILFASGVYFLNPELNVVVDVPEFRKLRRQGTVEALERAHALYEDEFCAGWEAGWIPTLRTLLASEHEEVLERLARAALVRGDFPAQRDYAVELFEINHGNEGAVPLGMLAYVGLGQANHALDLYEEHRRWFTAQLHANLPPALQDLHNDIVAGVRDVHQLLKRFPLGPAA